MKKILINIAIVILAGVGFTSCEDMFGDFLDKAPGADLTEDQVFSEWKKTEYYYNDIYNFLPNGLARISNSWLDAASDLGMTSYAWGGVRSSLNIGNYFSSGAYNEVIEPWYQSYKAIRKVNIFLAKVDSVPLNTGETKEDRLGKVKRMKAETRFLRAFFYWELVRRYGAVPIIKDRYEPTDPDLNKAQRPSSIDTCINFIRKEIDNVYGDLINESTDEKYLITDYGKITQGVCMAFKSRLLLYLASPQYNTSNSVSRWQEAMDIANEFINIFGHKNPAARYQYRLALSLDTAINKPAFSNNHEAIFWRNNPKGDWWKFESPVSFGGYGGLCPTQNLVDMYDMKNGKSPFTEYDETGAPVYADKLNGVPKSINTTSGYSEQKPYESRDPRFYYTVLYNGARWWNETIDTYEGGKDKPVGNSDATPTGYYNRKYHNEDAHYLRGETVYRNWNIIRYAEILLNYAEARNEVLDAPDEEVYTALQMLRSRAGITGNLSVDRPNMTKEEMRKFIRKERAVELCFEEQRWWDVRRWKVAEEALGRPVYGMKIVKNVNSITYSRIKVQDRPFYSRMYLYPIPENEIWKTGMTNNPGW